jgi:uncharacterized protein (TIGR01777 family)
MKSDTFVYRSRMPASAMEVFAWHMRQGAFSRFAPSWDRMRLIADGHPIREGSHAEIDVSIGPLWLRWTAEHHDFEPGRRFRDVQIRGPFARWEHTHTIEPEGTDESWLEDRIEYVLPYGPIGRWLGRGWAKRKLRSTFQYRHRTLADDLSAHHRARAASGTGTSGMRIVVSGSSGLIGSSLVPFLTTGGNSVTRLVRRDRSGGPAVRWDPVLGTIDREGLEDYDALVHLAGENISSGRWNARTKKLIRDSRLEGTRLLCETINRLQKPPKTLVCASAIGFYGDRGDEVLDERFAAGEGFLADLCKDWETLTESVRPRGIRVVNVRFGVVLSPAGGALAKMLTPFKLGAGGVVGSGRQYLSWIAIDDAVGAIHHAITSESLNGPVNVVSPNPVTNRDFTKTLGRVLRRPTVLPMPAFAARLAFGEMADELLLASTRVVPHRLEETAYKFRHPDLEPALRHLLGR